MRIATKRIATKGIATKGIATKGIATKGIATKGIATKRIATKGIATKRIATKGIATKGIAFPDLSDLCEKHMFYKFGHNSGPRGSPDMILTAFDVKFHETKNELPPEVCRPLTQLNKNNVEQVDPQQVYTNQGRTSGPPNSC